MLLQQVLHSVKYDFIVLFQVMQQVIDVDLAGRAASPRRSIASPAEEGVEVLSHVVLH